MYENCEQDFLKGTLGELVSQNVDQLYELYTEFDSDTLRIQLSILAESYHSFRQGEGCDTFIMSLISSKRTKKIWFLIPWQQQMTALNMNHV